MEDLGLGDDDVGVTVGSRTEVGAARVGRAGCWAQPPQHSHTEGNSGCSSKPRARKHSTPHGVLCTLLQLGSPTGERQTSVRHEWGLLGTTSKTFSHYRSNDREDFYGMYVLPCVPHVGLDGD